MAVCSARSQKSENRLSVCWKSVAIRHLDSVKEGFNSIGFCGRIINWTEVRGSNCFYFISPVFIYFLNF